MAIPKEVAQFLKEEKEKKEFYKNLGMDDESIQILCLYDRREFYKNYEFKVKAYPFTSFITEKNEENAAEYIDNLFSEQLSKEDDISTISRYRWIETLQDENLLKAINDLLPEDMEMLTLIVIEGYKEKELVDLLGKSYSTIKRKYARIKRKFKRKL